MKCLFCAIASKEIPAYAIYEDDTALAFLDIHPRAPGHTVVVPKKHSTGLTDLPDNEIEPFFRAVKVVSNLLMKALAPDGLTIGVNQGRAAGQAIDHLHLHLIPRFQGDRGTSIHGVVENVPKESLEAIASKIEKARIPH